MRACMLSRFSHVRLCNPMDCSPPGSSPRDSPGKSTGMGCHALLLQLPYKLQPDWENNSGPQNLSFGWYDSQMGVSDCRVHIFPLSAEAPPCGLDRQLLTRAPLSSFKDAGGLCCPDPLYDWVYWMDLQWKVIFHMQPNPVNAHLFPFPFLAN